MLFFFKKLITLILKKHLQNYNYEESWGKSIRLTQGAFILRGITLYQKQTVNADGKLKIPFLKTFLPQSPQNILLTLAFWHLHLGHSRDGTTLIPNLFSEKSLGTRGAWIKCTGSLPG